MTQQSIHHLRTDCRVCGGLRLRKFLMLGDQPLANSFLASPEHFFSEKKFPLDVYFCEDCSLVQLLDVIDPESLFSRYIYVTGTSSTIAAHNIAYAAEAVEFARCGPRDLIVEVASNDGSLLTCFAQHGVRTLGVEPASNIAAMARERGVETLSRFFSLETARLIRDSHGPAKVIVGNNVLAHVDHACDFLSGFRELLAEDGLAILEVPYLGEFVDRLEYDTVYHEHLCYFSVTTLARLCEAVGLRIVRVEHVMVHGGSIRMYAGRVEKHADHARDVLAEIERERSAGLTSFVRYERFAHDVAGSRESLVTLLRQLRGGGKTLGAYGAPAKGNTLLNYCDIDPSLISFTVDKNPMKVGTFTPGMHIPVLEVSALLERRPDYCVILAWNFAAEIMHQQHAYREAGGRFIIPVPHARIM